MKYVKTTELDYENTFFHFSRIDNRESIEKYGLQSVAGGENKAGKDEENPTIYFSYKADGVLKAVDVWIKWKYNCLRHKRNYPISPAIQVDEAMMKETYQVMYEDFKNRNYYTLDLIEGEDPKTSDFSFQGIDKKKKLIIIAFWKKYKWLKSGK